MTGRRGPVLLVARRELATRMVTRANVVSLLVMVVLILAGALVGRYVMDRDSGPQVTRLGVEESSAALREHLETAAAAAGVELRLAAVGPDDARDRLTAPDDPLDAVVTGPPASPRLLVEDGPDSAALELVTAAVRGYVVADRIGALGGDPEAFDAALAAAVPQVESLDPGGGTGLDGPALLVSTVMIALLLFGLIGSGSMIAMGVVEEKTSRVVEILLATIRPTQLLAGKVLGIGAYGLFQMAVLGGALAVAARILGVTSSLSIDVEAALLWLVVWFVLGYGLFALLFGGFAALVSRQEEIGSVTTPLLFALFVPFYLTMFLVPRDPDSSLVRALSLVPFFAPFMMPVRDAFGALDPWEMPVALALTAGTIPLLVWLAARVYQRGVLHTGGRMRLRDALHR